MATNGGNTMRHKEHFTVCGEHVNKLKNTRKNDSA